jgi:hypothetical protein
MTTLTYGLWGLLGVACVEGLEFVRAIEKEGVPPWRPADHPEFPWYIAATVVRLGIGFVLASATAASGQIAGPFGAIAMGISAPLIIEKLAKQVPLEEVTSSGRPALPSDSSDPQQQPDAPGLDAGGQTAGGLSIDGKAKEWSDDAR